MSTFSIGLIIFAFVYGAALVGMLLHAILPENHRTNETKDVVKVAVGLVATMSALLLGLLVASAKGSYDAQQGRLIQMAAKIAFLDRSLSLCGPDAGPVRAQLRSNVENLIDRVWPSDGSVNPDLKPFAPSGDAFFEALNKLSPQTEEARAAKASAIKTSLEIGELYGLIYAQAGTKIPAPLLIAVVTWLLIIFVSFGLFAPPNGTALAALTIAAFAVSAALFMVLELDRAFGGIVGISSGPMRMTLEHLGV